MDISSHTTQLLSPEPALPTPALMDRPLPVPSLPTAPPSIQSLPNAYTVNPMLTRSRDGTRKLKVPLTGLSSRHPLPTCLQSLLHDLNDEATCYTEASKRPHWRAAMLDEFNALLKERTWSLVPASQAKKIVGCQSVFKVKRKADGTIERHKARLLAKGYTIKKMALTLMKL